MNFRIRCTMAFFAVFAATLFTGCRALQGPPVDVHYVAHDEGPRNYLAKGPTVQLSESIPATDSPLKTLQNALAELDQLRMKHAELVNSYADLETDRSTLATEIDRIHTLNESLLVSQRESEKSYNEVMDRLLQLKLEKVRLEKKNVQLKLEQIVAERTK